MTGVVNDVRGTVAFPEDVVVGAPFVAELTYDLGAADGYPDDPGQGFYRHRPPTGAFGLTFSVGGLTFRSRTDNDFYVGVTNDSHRLFIPDDPQPPADYFMVLTSGFTGGIGVDGLQFGLASYDPTGLMFTDDQLPDGIDITRLVEPTIGVSWSSPEVGDTQMFFGIGGRITDIRTIPEPPALIVSLTMFLIACCAVACRRLLSQHFLSPISLEKPPGFLASGTKLPCHPIPVEARQ